MPQATTHRLIERLPSLWLRVNATHCRIVMMNSFSTTALDVGNVRKLENGFISNCLPRVLVALLDSLFPVPLAQAFELKKSNIEFNQLITKS